MSRLFPILASLWAVISSIIVGLAVDSINDWIKNPHSDPWQLFLASGPWLIGVFVGIGVLTVWSYWDKRRKEKYRERTETKRGSNPTIVSDSQVVMQQHAGRDILIAEKIEYHSTPAAGAPSVGAPVASASVPRQLPLPPPDFVGRDEEFNELVAALQGGAAISGLQGMGGIGKTVLALKVAERLAPNYPDGQLYLDLKGARHPTDRPEDRPLTVADAMAYVIRSYDRTAPTLNNSAELEGAYRTLLAGKRALLLMDNALDKEQVEPLIPPVGCAMLITSRQRFTLPGLYAKSLDKLPPAQARELLLKIAQRIGERAHDLAKLCDYLPAALRTAASALAEHLDLGTDDLLSRMRDNRNRLKLTGVELSLTTSAELLSAELRGRWFQLAVFPGTFDQPAAAAVLEPSVEAAHDSLSALLKHSLVEWNAVTKRYRLHDLARDFTGSRLDQPGRAAAERRHAAYYESVLGVAERRYLQGGKGVRVALAIFDTEWTNIRTGQTWAAGHSGKDDMAATFCEEYPEIGINLLTLRQHPRERIEWLEAALAVAQRLKHRAAEGSALGNLGTAYYSLGEYRRAIRSHDQHLAIAREIHDSRGEANALGSLGNAYYAVGEYARAIDFQWRSLAVARKIGDRHIEGCALGNLGNGYDSLGDYPRAIEFHEKSLAVARATGDQHAEGNAFGNLGSAYYAVGEHARAIDFHSQALRIMRKLGARHGEGNALGNLGLVYHSLGEFRRAIDFHERHLAIAREIGDSHGQASALFNGALTTIKLEDYSQAIARAEAALSTFERIGSPHAATVRKQLAEWRKGR